MSRDVAEFVPIKKDAFELSRGMIPRVRGPGGHRGRQVRHHAP